jgi:hypothetical protein
MRVIKSVASWDMDLYHLRWMLPECQIMLEGTFSSKETRTVLASTPNATIRTPVRTKLLNEGHHNICSWLF